MLRSEFAPYILDQYSDFPEYRTHTSKLCREDIGPPLRFIPFIYEYLKKSNTYVILITTRSKEIERKTNRNFDIYDLPRSTIIHTKKKDDYIQRVLSPMFGKILAITDQEEIKTVPVIYTPSLYISDYIDEV